MSSESGTRASAGTIDRRGRIVYENRYRSQRKVCLIVASPRRTRRIGCN